MATRKAKKTPKKANPKKTVGRKPAAASPAEVEAQPVAERAAPEPKPSKTAFVLSQPVEMTPKQVAEAAAAQGLEINPKYVSNIRSEAKATAKKEAPKKARAEVPTKPASRGRPVGSGFGNKSEFIRQQPLDMPPAEVVTEGKKAGLTFTAGLVYGVRKQLKKSGKASSTPTGAKRRGRPSKAKAASQVSGGVSDREKKLVSLALDVGLARAQELIAGIKTRLADLI